MGKKCLEQQVREDYQKLTKLLIQENLTISTMESATGGQIASLITDTQGASAIMKGAFVTYSNEAKIMQGVPEEILDTYSVYSTQTALAMAKRCKQVYDADIGIGVTGTMGNIDPNHPDESQPGMVYYAICVKDREFCTCVKIPPQENRLAYKMAVAKEINNKLTEELIHVRK